MGFNKTIPNSGASVVASTSEETTIESVDVLANLTAAVTFKSSANVTYFVLPASTIANTYYFESTVGNGLTIASASASDYNLVLTNLAQ